MAHIKRVENYFGRSTPIIEWHVVLGDRVIVECRTKREALEWLKVYS